MDLTTGYPRSVRAKWQGVYQLGRAIDKGKAKAQGKLGEYNYDCPMDKSVFAFLGIDGEKLLDVVKNAKSDAEIEAYTRPFVANKSESDIDAWNAEFVTHGPSEESKGYFLELRNSLDPSRTDITTWADLLDLDEKREVPRRTPAAV